MTTERAVLAGGCFWGVQGWPGSRSGLTAREEVALLKGPKNSGKNYDQQANNAEENFQIRRFP